MTINDKILQFLAEKKISFTEIAKERGVTPQNISQSLKKDKAALDFILWLAEKYPEIDLNLLLKPVKVDSIVSEPRQHYGNLSDQKPEIMKKIADVLDKYI